MIYRKITRSTTLLAWLTPGLEQFYSTIFPQNIVAQAHACTTCMYIIPFLCRFAFYPTRIHGGGVRAQQRTLAKHYMNICQAILVNQFLIMPGMGERGGEGEGTKQHMHNVHPQLGCIGEPCALANQHMHACQTELFCQKLAMKEGVGKHDLQTRGWSGNQRAIVDPRWNWPVLHAMELVRHTDSTLRWDFSYCTE